MTASTSRLLRVSCLAGRQHDCVINGLDVTFRLSALAIAAGQLLYPDGRSPWELAVLAATGLLHVEVGLRLRRAHPDSGMGRLMVAAGFLWLLNTWGWVAWPVLCGQGLLLSMVYDPLLLHGTLIIPRGRLHGRFDRLMAVVAYLFWPVAIAAIWLSRTPEVPSVADLMVVRGFGYPVIGLGLLVVFIVRYLRAAPADRRAFAPFWGGTLVNTVATTALSATAYGAVVWPAMLFAVGAAMVPVGAAISLARTDKRRLIESADRQRERVERDVHDGVQQRLLAAVLMLRQAQRTRDSELLDRGAVEVETAIAELRELVRGMNPPALVRYGLSGAIASIADRAPVQVEVDGRVDSVRVPEPVAVAAYYVALEAVANSQKHAAAQAVRVSLATEEDRLVVTVRDDGVGGACAVRGGGLRGLRDRVESCGGNFRLASVRGEGTTIKAVLPLDGGR